MSRYQQLMSAELFNLREKIDNIDKLVFKLLAKRMHLVTEIGELKIQKGLPVYVPERETSILELHSKEAIKLGISQNFVKDILRRIITESYFYEQ